MFSNHELGVHVIKNFLDIRTQALLTQECTKLLDNCEWSNNHFDNTIVGYREAMISQNRPLQSQALEFLTHSIKGLFFSSSSESSLESPHIIELSSQGFIKPHIDNVSSLVIRDVFDSIFYKYCGEIIIGVSLLSQRSMTFTSVSNLNRLKSFMLDLPVGSLYIQRYYIKFKTFFLFKPPRGLARYRYTHSVDTGPGGRISIIYRTKQNLGIK